VHRRTRRREPGPVREASREQIQCSPTKAGGPFVGGGNMFFKGKKTEETQGPRKKGTKRHNRRGGGAMWAPDIGQKNQGGVENKRGPQYSESEIHRERGKGEGGRAKEPRQNKSGECSHARQTSLKKRRGRTQGRKSQKPKGGSKGKKRRRNIFALVSEKTCGEKKRQKRALGEEGGFCMGRGLLKDV